MNGELRPARVETTYANPVNDVCWTVGLIVLVICVTALALRAMKNGGGK